MLFAFGLGLLALKLFLFLLGLQPRLFEALFLLIGFQTRLLELFLFFLGLQPRLFETLLLLLGFQTRLFLRAPAGLILLTLLAFPVALALQQLLDFLRAHRRRFDHRRLLFGSGLRRRRQRRDDAERSQTDQGDVNQDRSDERLSLPSTAASIHCCTASSGGSVINPMLSAPAVCNITIAETTLPYDAPRSPRT